MNLDWDTPGFVAQAAHVGCGATFVFVLALLFLPLWTAVLVVALFALGKELIECTLGLWEARDSWSGSAIDFAFWAAGIAMAAGTLLVAKGA